MKTTSIFPPGRGSNFFFFLYLLENKKVFLHHCEDFPFNSMMAIFYKKLNCPILSGITSSDPHHWQNLTHRKSDRMLRKNWSTTVLKLSQIVLLKFDI